jgi:uncharacterized protein (TIGR02118 family)
VVKLIALYKKPADVAAFEKHYTEIHAPLAKKMPGLQKLEISHMTGSPGGEPKFYMTAELYFESQDEMMASLSSPQGKAAAKDVMGFAGDILHMMFAKVDG